MSDPKSVLNQIIDQRKQINELTGTLPVIPTPQPGMIAAPPNMSPGKRASFAQVALDPQV